MRDLKNKLTSGKNTKNTKSRKGKSFGYQVLGFGSGVAGDPPVNVNYLVVAGGGGGGKSGGGQPDKFRGVEVELEVIELLLLVQVHYKVVL